MKSWNGSEARESPRFPGALPVITGSSKGITRNLSSSGILFETDDFFFPGQAREFLIVLEYLYPDRPAFIQCGGAIVRVEKNGKKTCVAATIDSYSIIDHLQTSVFHHSPPINLQ